MEVWKKIDGFDFEYEVSSKGRFKYPLRVYYDRLGRKRTFQEKIVEARKKFENYKLVGVVKNGVYLNKHIHTFVAKAFPEICGEYFEGCVVDHIVPVSDGGLDVPENLRICTQGENNNNPLSVAKTKNTLTGYKHTEEAKKNMSVSHKKMVMQITEDGKVHIYDSVGDAANEYGVNSGRITERIKGIVNKVEGVWCYV